MSLSRANRPATFFLKKKRLAIVFPHPPFYFCSSSFCLCHVRVLSLHQTLSGSHNGDCQLTDFMLRLGSADVEQQARQFIDPLFRAACPPPRHLLCCGRVFPGNDVGSEGASFFAVVLSGNSNITTFSICGAHSVVHWNPGVPSQISPPAGLIAFVFVMGVWSGWTNGCEDGSLGISPQNKTS